MSRTRNTQLLAIISALNLLVTSLSSIILGRLVLVHLGSEYNGINSIVSQFLMIISVLEGGFTTASLVAMMKPYEQKEIVNINQIFAETKTKFNKIARLSIVIGSIGAVVYGTAVNTTVSSITVISVLVIGLISSTFNMGVVSKYRLVYQAAQEEHIFALITLCTNIVGQAGMIIVLVVTKNIVFLRLVGMLTTMLAGAISIKVFSSRYPIINKKTWDGTNRIKGTKDVLVGKIVGTIHSSSTALFLSVFSNASITSVYAVYNSIIHVITSIANIGFTAPQNAIGQVLQSGSGEQKGKMVMEFEYVVIILLTILFVPLSVLLVPFVSVYTQGITDIEYVNYFLAFLMVVSTYFQLIHIPAGICIYMSGSFKKAKQIQLIALALLLIGNLMLGILFKVYGILINVMICNAFLATYEIIYVHTKIVQHAMKKFLYRWIPNVFLMFLLILAGTFAAQFIQGLFSWILAACSITVVTIIGVIAVNIAIYRVAFMEIIKHITSAIKKKRVF